MINPLPVENPINLLKAEFLTSATSLKQLPVDLVPEVAFAGRSNAGKSSVLNAVTCSNKLARVSKTPGHTRLLNLYNLDQGGRLVDLPGYGYAKVAKTARREWNRNTEDYLQWRQNLSGVVLVVDCRRQLQAVDWDFIDRVSHYNCRLLILLNKIDKLSRGAVANVLQHTQQQIFLYNDIEARALSARKGTGLPSVLEVLHNWLGYDAAPI